MKIALTAGEVSKIVLKHLRDTTRIPPGIQSTQISQKLTNLVHNSYIQEKDVELLTFTFEVPE